MPPKYRYFNPAQDPEMVGIVPNLMAMLDAARGKAGVPFRISSGLRTPDLNRRVGGVINSAHLTGEAADLECLDAFARFRIVRALLDVGFLRIEVSKDGHIHCDIGKAGFPQEWLGIE